MGMKQPIKIKSDGHKMIFQLKIILDESNPIVWRRVLVPGNLSLEKLHLIIQIAMGWENSHLHEFHIKEKRFINPIHDPDGMDAYPLTFSEKKFKISDLLIKSDEFKYLYDFGDGWSHSVIVEQIDEFNEMYLYPLCTDGANACPPEDCGGISRYENLLENLKNKESEEHFELMAWIGGQFNPFSFDANRVNRDGLWQKKW